MKWVVSARREGDVVVAAAVGFEDWPDAEPARTLVVRVPGVPPAKRGEPDDALAQAVLRLREQPGVAPLELVLVDGAVHLDAAETPGPGARVFQALQGAVPVIGLSKAAPRDGSTSFEVHREDEAPPLYVSAAGVDLGAAKARVRAMHGRRRLPTLLKAAARVAREAA